MTGMSGMISPVASMAGSISVVVVEGTHDYDKLENLPTINGVVVKGDLTSEDLKIERGYDARIDPEDPEHLILSV